MTARYDPIGDVHHLGVAEGFRVQRQGEVAGADDTVSLEEGGGGGLHSSLFFFPRLAGLVDEMPGLGEDVVRPRFEIAERDRRITFVVIIIVIVVVIGLGGRALERGGERRGPFRQRRLLVGAAGLPVEDLFRVIPRLFQGRVGRKGRGRRGERNDRGSPRR